jgi:hypothetical protein
MEIHKNGNSVQVSLFGMALNTGSNFLKENVSGTR